MKEESDGQKVWGRNHGAGTGVRGHMAGAGALGSSGEGNELL